MQFPPRFGVNPPGPFDCSLKLLIVVVDGRPSFSDLLLELLRTGTVTILIDTRFPVFTSTLPGRSLDGYSVLYRVLRTEHV